MNLYADNVRPEFRNLFGNYALQTLLDYFEFESVLDIGGGTGEHASLFASYGKKVTCIDFGTSVYAQRMVRPELKKEWSSDKIKLLHGDFNSIDLDTNGFGCVWASHVLEHQKDVSRFLRKIHFLLNEGGVLCITVPPAKHQIVGGHLTLWNAGLLIYNLVVNGFNCRNISICQYGYNISAILIKESILKMPALTYDNGDLNTLSPYLPSGLGEGFNGDIRNLNWPWPV